MCKKIREIYEVGYLRHVFDPQAQVASDEDVFEKVTAVSWESAVMSLRELHDAYVASYLAHDLPVPDANFDFYAAKYVDYLVDDGLERQAREESTYDELFAVEDYTDSSNIDVLDEDPMTGQVLYGVYVDGMDRRVSCLVDAEGEEWYLNDWEDDQPRTVSEFLTQLEDLRCQDSQGIYEWAIASRLPSRSLFRLCDAIERGRFDGYLQLLENVEILRDEYSETPYGATPREVVDHIVYGPDSARTLLKESDALISVLDMRQLDQLFGDENRRHGTFSPRSQS